MSKVFKNQALKLILTTGIDITGATAKKIKHVKPDGTEGDNDITVINAFSGMVYYIYPNDILNQTGDWRFWAYITLSGGKSYPGEVVKIRIYDEGE